MHVSEKLVPNDAKSLTGQVVDLQSDIVIRIIEDGDWRSRIDSRRRWWVDILGSMRAAGAVVTRAARRERQRVQ
jgi:hypothetical protein